MSEVSRSLSTFNRALSMLSELGGKYLIEIEGRPDLKIDSVDPLVYTRYGLIRNRAPQLAGKFALVKYIWAEEQGDSAAVIGILEAEPGLHYGLNVDQEFIVEAAEAVNAALEQKANEGVRLPEVGLQQ